MVSLLAVKAEVVLGLQLVSRHRAPRLAALLALGVAGLTASADPSPERVARVALFVAATLAAVSASRLLSPGPRSRPPGWSWRRGGWCRRAAWWGRCCW